MMHHELADAMFREVFAKHTAGAATVQVDAAKSFPNHTVVDAWVVPCSCGAVNKIPESWTIEETQEEHLINVLTRLFSHKADDDGR